MTTSPRVSRMEIHAVSIFIFLLFLTPASWNDQNYIGVTFINGLKTDIFLKTVMIIIEMSGKMFLNQTIRLKYENSFFSKPTLAVRLHHCKKAPVKANLVDSRQPPRKD